MPTTMKPPVYLDRCYTALPPGVCLNPMQELLVPHMDEDYNVLVAAKTASGKSTAMYMFGHKWVRTRKKKIVYIGIMRALAQEKYEDFTEPDHPWADIPKTVISGDYKIDAAKQSEIDKAQLICITPEALASRLRHPHSERNKFLQNIGLLVVDEVHLLTAQDRGTNLEAALIEFTAEFPEVQILGLSATMPNVEEIGEWFTVLNKQHTEIIVSDFRPVPLQIHYVEYEDTGSRDDVETDKINLVLEIMEEKDPEQFLIAVWAKTFGKKVEEAIKRERITAAFHNANHDRVTKTAIETSFKKGNTRALVSTSTLFTGVNLPARNVIATAVEAGGGDIPVWELMQAAGRAGRPRYDTEGDAYFFLPRRKFDYHMNRIQTGEPIRSWLNVTHWLAAHFLGAVYLKRISNPEQFAEWFGRTLAQLQNHYTAQGMRQLLNIVLADMRARRMVMFDDYTKEIRLAHRGKIAAQMYMDPYHFSDALMNIHKYVCLNRPTDVDLAIAMSHCRGYAQQSITWAERASLPPDIVNSNNVRQEYLKAAAVVYYRITGQPVPPALGNMNFVIYEDMPRLHGAVSRAHAEVERWPEVSEDRLDMLFTRVILKCNEEHAELSARKFTKTERRKLAVLGIYSFRDAQESATLVEEALSRKRCIELGIVGADGKAPSATKPFGNGKRFGNR